MSDASVHSVIEQPLSEIISGRYLSYALSTITGRALPDVRDGLKPVHRRLLYAMHELRLSPENSPKKSARVVGDVIGKYHPHGDTAVYDAMVRLAQDFSVRYPLVDGQGNFGNIDGDNPAAMRYTEARLTAVALRLLEGINEDAVDFRETYDGSEEEPVVLPANFPNLLANGASGIAVGMATNIPPHNVAELCAGMLLMLEEDVDEDKLCTLIKGPDFPTGGVLVEPHENIVNAYKTGKGSFRLRARWHTEELKQGLYRIIVTEIPYGIQKSRLMEKLDSLVVERKIAILEDAIDESAEDIRIVITPKNRNVDANLLMEALFKNSDLEVRFSLNMNVLDGGKVPKVMSLKEVLRSWLDHRQVVLVRRSAFRLDKVLHRLEILQGYLIVYLNIDEVIRIIREEDSPKESLMQTFSLSEVQAEAILNMRLRNLRKLEEMELRKEHDALEKERDDLEKLLASEARQWTAIKKQIQEIAKDFSEETPLGKRRTDIGDVPQDTDLADLEQAMVEKEPITVICSKMGWVRAMKGHGLNPQDIKYKEGDREGFVLEAQTTDKVLLLATNGRFYTLDGSKLPPGRGFGEPVRLMVDLPNDADIVILLPHKPEQKFLIAATSGHGYILPAKDLVTNRRAGVQILSVSGKVEAKLCVPVQDSDDTVAVIGDNRKMLVFELAELPEMGKGKGVILQKYKDGGLSDAKTFNMQAGFTYVKGNGVHKVDDIRPWLGKRATAGRLPPNGFPRNNKF
ncbi:MAG: DNA topoisomerase IV subunit A [Rhodospirillales bacterium]|nr:DNA topoisomerase IV subunit A [Rhodospirillales bacterium]MCB9965422.1 DNA topoisomerase IV subunit A [Rhodospirillales bacterium]MCB9973935.1 DNA topoisomerase IV subunit A [Rhodospirillales bacterium]MCB9979873.1 DNA topoisomerase IV subunit A [Rhodospirillales bacterium]